MGLLDKLNRVRKFLISKASWKYALLIMLYHIVVNGKDIWYVEDYYLSKNDVLSFQIVQLDSIQEAKTKFLFKMDSTHYSSLYSEAQEFEDKYANEKKRVSKLNLSELTEELESYDNNVVAEPLTEEQLSHYYEHDQLRLKDTYEIRKEAFILDSWIEIQFDIQSDFYFIGLAAFYLILTLFLSNDGASYINRYTGNKLMNELTLYFLRANVILFGYYFVDEIINSGQNALHSQFLMLAILAFLLFILHGVWYIFFKHPIYVTLKILFAKIAKFLGLLGKNGR